MSGCGSLENVDGLANLTNLTGLNLFGCTSLENVGGLANLTNLTSLDLGSYSFENVDGLASLTNLTNLDLGDSTDLSVLPVKRNLTTRKQVAAYQERIKKAM